MPPALAKDFSAINGTIRRETEKALLLVTGNLEGEIIDAWLPFSQIQSIHRGEEHDTVVVANWILKEKGVL